VSEFVAPRAIAREVYRHKIAGNRIAVQYPGEAPKWLAPEEIEVDEKLLRDSTDAEDAIRYREALLRCAPLRRGLLRRAESARATVSDASASDAN